MTALPIPVYFIDKVFNGRKVYSRAGALMGGRSVPIIDHCSKVIVGHALDESVNTDLALEAWEKAKFISRRFG
jgi:hypothetical protein